MSNTRDVTIQAAINTAIQDGYPQIKQIVEHLASRRGAKLSAYEAIMLYRIHALPKRITEVMDYGIPVKRYWQKDNTGRNYRVYEIDWD